MKWFLKALNQYADFKTRARRTEFWMFYLFSVIIYVFAMIWDRLLGLSFNLYGESLGFGWIYTIVGLFLFIPGLAVCVRRLHDVGKSGWWYFIGFVPFVGAILLLVWLCTDSRRGENKWGANPKEELIQ